MIFRAVSPSRYKPPREREFIVLPVGLHESQKNDYTFSSNSSVTQYNDLCTMAGSIEKLLGYRVEMLPDTNAVNSEIKKNENRKKIHVNGNTIRYK